MINNLIIEWSVDRLALVTFPLRIKNYKAIRLVSCEKKAFIEINICPSPPLTGAEEECSEGTLQ